jgi:hypothetical protein
METPMLASAFPMARILLLLLLVLPSLGCITYEYEHEIWLKVDGSGTVNITGRPALWVAFKGLGRMSDPEGTATREAAQALFERSGLRVRRVTLTRRAGEPYLFVSADFDDVNRLAGTPAFPDLQLTLRPEGEHLRLRGTWTPPAPTPVVPEKHREGLMAVRFHLPAKVYGHDNAVEGVERGNIVGWRQTVAEGLSGKGLRVGAEMDQRSILWATVGLFATAAAIGLSLVFGVLWWVHRRGRRDLARSGSPGS